MSSSIWRSGRGGGRAGGEDRRVRAEEAWRVQFVRGVGAKRRAVRKYTNHNAPVPTKLAPFAPGGEFYENSPPMPAMTPEFYSKFVLEEDEEEHLRAQLAGDGLVTVGGAGHRLFVDGEDSSGGGGARGDLLFPRDEEEEAAMTEQAMEESKAMERAEEERAVAEVQAFIAEEERRRRAQLNSGAWIILE